MSDIAHHFVRRAITATQAQYAQGAAVTSDNGREEFSIKPLATWGILLLWATGLLYFALIAAIDYTYGDVVATLTMVETPTATAFKTTSAEEESEEIDAPLLSEEQVSEKQKLKAVETDLFLVKQPPITSKMRTAVRHLRAVGGPLARFRGLHVALLYHAVHGCVVNFFTSSRSGLLRPLVSVLVTIALCRVQMLWTHIVISNPSQQRWYKRFPSVAAGKHVIVPTAVYAIAMQAAVYIPAVLAASTVEPFINPTNFGDPETARKFAVLQACGVIFVSFSVFIATIPAKVTLHRVQASLLPEEDETIVPFDRTFGGKVKPEILGGSGAIGMLDAWKTFDKDARIRLIKLYLKLFGIQIFATVGFAMAIISELRLIMGDDFNKLIKAAQEQLRGQQ